MANTSTQSLPDLWRQILQKLPEGLALTLRESVAVGFLSDDTIEITANNQFIFNRIASESQRLQELLQELYGRAVPLKLSLDKNLKIHTPDPVLPEQQAAILSPSDIDSSYYIKPNPRWTFETFQHGPYNHIAYFTGHRLANWDSECPSVFLLAAGGSGKSHLAHAIWQEAMKRRPHANVVYVHAKALMEHYRRVMRRENPRAAEERSRFQRLYHEADLFILDDVHRFCDPKNKWTKSRDALRDILEDLRAHGALVMIISVLPVDGLIKCEEELRSRLRGMMVVKLDSPDYQARAAILKRLIRERGFIFPENREDELIMAILERLPYDMRRLTQGTVPTLENYAKAIGSTEITEEIIAACFSE